MTDYGIQPYGAHMYSIGVNLIHTIEQLYDKATSAVQMNGSMGEWFRKKRQSKARQPSVTLYNIFLVQVMSDALEEHDGKVSIGVNRQSAVCR